MSRLRLRHKFRMVYAYFNLVRFLFKRFILGFDIANLFIQRVDKISLQLILRKNGAMIGDNCDIESGLVFHNCTDYSNLVIGNNCHIGKNCFFDLRDKVEIKNNVVISMQVTFITHIDMNKSPLSLSFPANSSPVTVNDGVYVGANSIILKGVVLGLNSFVAAGSLVNHSIEPNKMAGGIPAKVIKEINL